MLFNKKIAAFVLFLFLISSSNFLFAQTFDSKSIKFLSEGNMLHGHLYLPKGKTNLPTIIFLPGSGSASYRTNYKRFIDEIILEQVGNDFAVMLFDKRGIEPSEGKWYTADFNDRAIDVYNAIQFIKTNPLINPNKIGVVGHSQGGWIAQIVASKYSEDVSFGVSLAGPTFSVEEQVIQDMQSENLCDGLSPEDARVKAESKTKRGMRFSGVLGIFSKGLHQLKVIKDYSPEEDIKTISVPFIFFFAENDELVYPDVAVKNLNKIFNSMVPEYIDYETVDSANHAFLITEKCYTGKWSFLEYSQNFKKSLKDWLCKQIE